MLSCECENIKNWKKLLLVEPADSFRKSLIFFACVFWKQILHKNLHKSMQKLHKSMFTSIFALYHSLLFWKAVYSQAALGSVTRKRQQEECEGRVLVSLQMK